MWTFACQPYEYICGHLTDERTWARDHPEKDQAEGWHRGNSQAEAGTEVTVRGNPLVSFQLYFLQSSQLHAGRQRFSFLCSSHVM